MAMKPQRTYVAVLIACGVTGAFMGLVLLHASLAVWHIFMLSADGVIAGSILYTGMASLNLGIQTRRYRKAIEENNRIGQAMMKIVEGLKNENSEDKHKDRSPVIH